MSHPLVTSTSSPAESPEWFCQARLHATALADSTPMPSRSDELWRFSNLKALDPQDFAPAAPVTEETAREISSSSQGLKEAGASLVFANDRLLEGRLSPELAALGVVFLPIQEALKSHSDILQKHLIRAHSPLGSSKYLALHQASMRAGTFLYVPKGVHVSAPLQSFHWLAGSGQAVFPHTLIVAEEDSSVTFVDWFKSAGEARNMACGANDLHLGKGARVAYVAVQDWSRQTVSLLSNTNSVAEEAAAHHLGLHLGGSFSRAESVSYLEGVRASATMLAATVADQEQEFDQRTLQEHKSPETFSDLLYKNALYDRAKTVVSGLIRVEPNAHRTDAFQKVRNLILSSEAEANSLPGLEILADNVRCSHGATTGEIDAEELFYMQARGIPAKDAYRLITFGFLNEVLERLPNADVVAQMQEVLRARLHNH